MDIAPTDSTADTESAAPAPPLDDTSDSPPTDAPRRPGRIVSMLAGFVSAATALAVAEALTVLARSWRSPVLDVGDRMVDIMASYPKVKQTAVDVLGNADKPALLLGIGALLTVYSLILGWVALRRSLLVGELMVGLFAVIGVWAALGRASDGSLFSALPTVIGAIAGVLVLRFLAGALQPRPANAGGPDAAADGGTDRRRFIGRSVVLLGGVAAAAALVGVGGRQVASRRFSAAGSRKNVTIPTAEEPLGAVPAGAQAPVDGMTPFITPNGDFYRVDTALEVPQLTHRRLHAEGQGHGRQRDGAVVERPAQPPDDRARHHDDVRVEHRRRPLRRHRPLDRRPPRRPAPRGRRATRRGHGGRTVERRLRVRLPGRQRDGRPRRHHRRRHERRAAPARSTASRRASSCPGSTASCPAPSGSPRSS